MSVTTWGWLVLAFPTAGTIIISLGFRRLPGRLPGWIASLAVLLSFAAGIGALISLEDRAPAARSVVSNLFDYVHTASVRASFGILVDPLSIFMVLVVSGVSFLIHVYSVAYMDSDRGYARFFAYLNYFVLSMLLLVLASNFVLLIIGWAFVGAASYLLISFWYRRSTATYAGIKAFVMNVIGDVGLVIGTFLLWRSTHMLDFKGVFAAAPHAFPGTNNGALVAACILLLVGAFAKSAQLPLHTWLPDAMEGPTPVSALIHAATMVTAGVYLIARMHPLFEQAPAAANVGAIVGAATLFMAATVALVVTDLKRVIAYSTMSQIGYMILGVSSGAYAAGLLHLMGHAFFKALLFMAAGSVISVMGGDQSLDNMGGMRRAIPFTFATFTIGALALSGLPPFTGWLTKDDILAFDLHRGGLDVALAIVGYVAAGLTAFYSFRMVFRVFFGKPVEAATEFEHGHQIHPEPFNPATGEKEDTDVGFPGTEHAVAERRWPMRFGMVPLAVLSIGAGAVAIPGVTNVVERFLEPTFSDSRIASHLPSTGGAWIGLVVGAVIAAAGIGVAYYCYLVRRGVTLELRDRLRPVSEFLLHKWYFDELYDAVFVHPVETFGRYGRVVIESAFIQGVVIGGATAAVRTGTSVARSLQTGYLRAYAALLIVGVGGLVLYFLVNSSS